MTRMGHLFPRTEFDEIWPNGTVTDVGQTRGHRGYEPIRKARRHVPRPLLVGILGLAIAAGMVQAGEIYKSIDADGKVGDSDHLDPSLSQSSAVQLDDARFAARRPLAFGPRRQHAVPGSKLRS